jgi:hypothetical protein
MRMVTIPIRIRIAAFVHTSDGPAPRRIMPRKMRLWWVTGMKRLPLKELRHVCDQEDVVGEKDGGENVPMES